MALDYPPTVELLINNGPPKCDLVVCATQLYGHQCYREPGHDGDHCCGSVCSGRNPCRYLWENENAPREPEQIEEREI